MASSVEQRILAMTTRTVQVIGQLQDRLVSLAMPRVEPPLSSLQDKVAARLAAAKPVAWRGKCDLLQMAWPPKYSRLMDCEPVYVNSDRCGYATRARLLWGHGPRGGILELPAPAMPPGWQCQVQQHSWTELAYCDEKPLPRRVVFGDGRLRDGDLP